MITFFHFSDFHILPEKGMTKDGMDPCNKVEKLIEIARGMEIKPAFSVITGDLSQKGSETGYRIVKEYLSEIEALGGPTFPVVGNVDSRANFRRFLLGEGDGYNDNPCFYSRSVAGIHLVVLDSRVPGTEGGAFGLEQLDWLEKELADNTERCVVAFHHPVTIRAFDPEDAYRFRKIVSETNVLAVLNGHLHQSLFAFENGIYYVTGSAALSEVVVTDHHDRIYDSSGFNILLYRDGALTVRPVVYSNGRRLIKTIPRNK